MSVDAHKNFAVSTVALAPSPASSGTSLIVAAGEGARFPTVPFNASVWPAGVMPTPANAEIVRVTAISTDTFTIVRATPTESPAIGPRAIVIGDQIAATLTAKDLADIAASAGGGAGVSTVTTTGNITALALPAGSADLVIRLNNATLATIQGIAAGASGQRLTLVSVGAGQVDLAHVNAGGTALGKLFNFATSGNTSLAPGCGSAVYEYDATATQWRIVSHTQGAWITPTFAAGDYTASAGAWTVTSGEVISCAYLLEGRKLTVKFYFQNTTVTATPVNLVRVIPGGFSAAGRTDVGNIWRIDNGGAGAAAGVYIPAGTAINFYLNLGQTGTWATSTTATGVVGMVMVEVQ